MQLPEGVLQKIKTGLYSLIAICVFLGWALTIAVFTKDGPVGGATRYYFFMVSTSINFLETDSDYAVDLDIHTSVYLLSCHTSLPSSTALRQSVLVRYRRCPLYDSMACRVCCCCSLDK